MRNKFRPLILSFALLNSGAASANAVLEVEQQLLQGLAAIKKYQLDSALTIFEKISAEHPNYKLANLLKADLLALKSGQADLIADVHQRFGRHVQALQEEARVRWSFANQKGYDSSLLDQYALKTANQPYVVFVSLPANRLFLFKRDEQGNLQLEQDFYITIGKKGAGKQREGDRRTPLGIYHIVDFIEDKRLPELYGVGALPLNYPNIWDKHLKRTGSGIWLHGVPRETYTRAPLDSRGCVVLSNEGMKRLIGDERLPLTTPVIISSEELQASLLNPSEVMQLESELRAWLSDNSPSVSWEEVSLFRYPNEAGLFYVTMPAKNHQEMVQQFWRRNLDGKWSMVLQDAESHAIPYVFGGR